MSPSGSAHSWIVRPRPDPQAALRLICFPYAGGSAAVFRTWPASLPAGVELWAIELPGRGNRAKERLFDHLPSLIASLTDAVGPDLTSPFAIYGHSLGALIGFSFASELRRRSLRPPEHLFVSGRRAPHLPDKAPMYRMPEPEFVAHLRRLGGLPDVVLQEPELMAYFLPIIRADMTVNDVGDDRPSEPLACPISALGGTLDERASWEQIEAWRGLTTAAFHREMFPSGHFFIQSERTAFLASLSRQLTSIVRAL